MTFMENMKKKKISPLLAAALSAVITLTVAGGAFYLIGNHAGDQQTAAVPHTTADHADEATLYTCGMHPWIISEEPGLCPICNMELTPKLDDTGSGDPSGNEERRIAYWRAPMDPTEIYDKPGKSKMGMDLVPVYEDEVIGGVEVKIDPVTQQNMGIRTQLVKKAPLIRSIRTYGHITYDETRTAEINPKFNGWIEKLHVDFTGQMVEKGEPLFDIYSPELLSAQEEFLAAHKNLERMKGDRGRDLLESTQRRLAYWDVPQDQIESIKKSGKVRKTITIPSPFSGVVTKKNADEGSYIKAGTTVFQIADLRKVWVEAHIFEYELPWIKIGQETEMSLPYEPGKKYTGTVSYVYPYLQQKTRDVVIRLEFDNPTLELKPDMYADIMIQVSSQGEGLVIPSEAVIRSGKRNLVFVTRGAGKFTPREITPGLTLDNGMVQVLSGVAENDAIVTSGQFLIDSESKLKEAVQKMIEAKTAKPPPKEESVNDFFKDM